MKTWYPIMARERTKRSKYGAEKMTVDGITFDSMKEAGRYAELKILEKAGRIEHLELQPEFEIAPSYKKNGHTIRRTVYRADFKYYDLERQKTIVEDVKGFKTETYKLKKKLVEYFFPEVTIEEL